MTPEQLRDEIAKDDATLEDVVRITSRYQRHTVDIDRQPMTVEDESPPVRFSGVVVAWVVGALLVGYSAALVFTHLGGR